MSASYVAVCGLSESELSPELCPEGLLPVSVPGLCKGGDDLFNASTGWLVFLRADRKESCGEQNDAFLSIGNKKIIHYNDTVLLPFIRAVRENLGWKPGQPVPEYMKASSWFDGDIGQLQTMLYEAREALDTAERICRNKHSAAATGTQQPCDLAPVFRILKLLQSKTTAKNDRAVGLAQTLEDLFANALRDGGLTLNPRKKKALIDFLRCLPENLEAVLKKKHMKKSFVEAGMTDAESGTIPVFDKLMGTCKRWVSCKNDIGLPKDVKELCRSQFQSLMKIQFDHGQVSYTEMLAHGIPKSKCLIIGYLLF